MGTQISTHGYPGLGGYDFDSAIVTGGGTGLGRALALALAADGVTVAIWGRRVETLEETRKAAAGSPGSIRVVECDVRVPESVERALAESMVDGKAPGMLVNNAAGAFVALAEDITPNGWSAVVGSSLTGVFYVSQAWSQARIASGGDGIVLNITSATVDNGSPGTAHSGAAKAGVASLTKTLAVEWARYGIRVNALAPGAFLTPGANVQIWSDASVERRILDAVPLGRFAELDDIVAPALFMLSSGARYVTGATLKVDGGWTLTKWLYRTPEDLP